MFRDLWEGSSYFLTLVDSSPSSGVALNGQTYVGWSLRLGGKLSTRFQSPKLKEVLLQLVLLMDVIYLRCKIFAIGFMVLICMLSYIKWWLQELHSMVEWISKDKCKMNMLYRCILFSFIVSIMCSVFKFFFCTTQDSFVILDGCTQEYKDKDGTLLWGMLTTFKGKG